MKPSIETIYHILGDLSKDIKEVKEIATLTNGRIKSLEIWRARLAGGMAVIIMILIPIAIQYISKIALAYYK
ncbi:MAG: hypothetical protein AAB922_06125 [Patescibacteria group bacterium]